MNTSAVRTTTTLTATNWQAIIDRALGSFRADELAAHALSTKPERRLRDALASSLRIHTNLTVKTEHRICTGSVDVVALRDSTPAFWLELKTGYTFDAVCSGGAILLAGKYGRGHSVASDVTKLQTSAIGEAYVLYAAVHPAGPLPDWSRGNVIVRDYFDKHTSALRRFGSADRLLLLNDRLCERFGRTGEVDGYRSQFGRFPLRHVLTHHAGIGTALGVQVSLHTWIWKVPLTAGQA